MTIWTLHCFHYRGDALHVHKYNLYDLSFYCERIFVLQHSPANCSDGFTTTLGTVKLCVTVMFSLFDSRRVHDSDLFLGSTGSELLDFAHECGQSLTWLFVLHVVLLRVSVIQLHLLTIHTHILERKRFFSTMLHCSQFYFIVDVHCCYAFMKQDGNPLTGNMNLGLILLNWTHWYLNIDYTVAQRHVGRTGAFFVAEVYVGGRCCVLVTSDARPSPWPTFTDFRCLTCCSPSPRPRFISAVPPSLRRTFDFRFFRASDMTGWMEKNIQAKWIITNWIAQLDELK